MTTAYKVFLSENEGSDMSTKNNEYLYQKYIDNALRIDGMPFDYGVYVFLSETCSDGKTKEGKLSYEVWDDVMLRFATNGKFVESTYTNAWSVPSLVNVSSSSGSDEKYFQAKTAFARYLARKNRKHFSDRSNVTLTTRSKPLGHICRTCSQLPRLVCCDLILSSMSSFTHG